VRLDIKHGFKRSPQRGVVYCADKNAQCRSGLGAILCNDRIADLDGCPREKRKSRTAAIHISGDSQNGRPIDLIQSNGKTQNGKQPFLYGAWRFTRNDLLRLGHVQPRRQRRISRLGAGNELAWEGKSARSNMISEYFFHNWTQAIRRWEKEKRPSAGRWFDLAVGAKPVLSSKIPLTQTMA
jgi:hypothetical protein